MMLDKDSIAAKPIVTREPSQLVQKYKASDDDKGQGKIDGGLENNVSKLDQPHDLTMNIDAETGEIKPIN